ncbi:MAG: biosynthetic peptidoglycan transglycosylase [Bacteroidia bacterium]
MRRLAFLSLILAGLGALGLLAWALRLFWLPFLLQWGMRQLGIGYLRYNAARWEELGRIELENVEILTAWGRLTAQALTFQVSPALSVQISDFRWKALPKSDPSSGTSPSEGFLVRLPPLPLRRIYRLWRLFSRLEELEAEGAIEEPHSACLMLSKQGQRGHFLVESSHGRLQGTFRGNNDSLELHVSSAAIVGPNSAFLAWDTLWLQARWHTAELLTLQAGGHNLRAYYSRLAARPIGYSRAGFFLTLEPTALSLMPRHMALDFGLHLRWRTDTPAVYLTLQVPEQPHDSFIRFFPAGFFTCLSQARFGGTSALTLQAHYDPTRPDTLDLQVDWQPKNFAILSWQGRHPLTLRESFLYEPPRSFRQIWLGPENPKYLLLHEITPYALQAVLHSEDGLFFYHKGFQKERLLQALVENWRCRCFRRGAGTLTMQLVRNLLLSREKTLARKLEEILLTAIIERFHLLSKERIAELYFNMVEWGPNIYGLTEAAQFYFNKPPSDLTMPEAIFLGLILPMPSAYQNFVDKTTGCALPSLVGHFRTIAHYLVAQHYLPRDSVETLTPERVCLTGDAWKAQDTLPK